MFGKPQWFKEKTWGWGIHPVSWQGWAWVAGWLAVMLTPYVAFLSAQMWAEGFIWLGAMVTAMLVDVWQIMNAMKVKQARPSASSTQRQPAFRPLPKTVPQVVEKEQPTKPTDDGIHFLGDPVPTGRGVGTKHFEFQVRK